MNESTVYCQFELERFPASQFYQDEQGRHIHKVEPQHTVEGFVLVDNGLPLPPSVNRPDEDSED